MGRGDVLASGGMSGRQEVIDTIARLLAEWEGGEPPADWENWNIPDFLEAMGRWLESYENAWTNLGDTPPTDGWVVFEAALRAAARYE